MCLMSAVISHLLNHYSLGVWGIKVVLPADKIVSFKFHKKGNLVWTEWLKNIHFLSVVFNDSVSY
jgi:hypothetical protein